MIVSSSEVTVIVAKLILQFRTGDIRLISEIFTFYMKAISNVLNYQLIWEKMINIGILPKYSYKHITNQFGMKYFFWSMASLAEALTLE